MDLRPKTTASTGIAETAARLGWLAASVDAVQGGVVNRFTACLSALEEVAKGLDAPLAVVGGLADIHHGAQVTTLAVDVAVSKNKLEAILSECPRHGLRLQAESPKGWHRFLFEHPEGRVEVRVIPTGANSPRDPPHAPPNPGPRDLGVSNGLGYASFAPWAVMKLIASREKDRYHLVEVLKPAGEPKISEIVRLLRPLHPSYLQELHRLVRAAGDEKAQERW